MRRLLLTLLAVVVIAGLFAATGYASFRFGYARGAQNAPATANGDNTPRIRPFDHFERPMRPGRDFGFDREFHREFRMHGFPMMGLGFFSPFRFLGQVLLIALIAVLVYWLFTRSGWQLTRTTPTTEAPVQPAATDVKDINNEPEA
jgi:hypothetical protein